MTGVVENTAYSQKVLESYKKHLKQKEQYAREQAKKKKKKQKKGAAAQPHASTKEPLKGVLGKGDKYAQNAYEFLKNHGRNAVYQDLSHAYLTTLRGKKLAHFKFPGGPVQNFNPAAKAGKGKKAGQRFPYVWEAHHMLPGSAFYFELDGKLCFTAAQRRLILQSDYNINHGHNMIDLPDQAWAVPIHRLIQHPGDHPNYTAKVMEDLRKLSKKLEKLKDKLKDHDKLKEKVFEMLQALEDDYWDYLVDLGKRSVAAVMAGKVLADSEVRYGTKKDKTKFKWGSLY